MKHICAWCGRETAPPDGNRDDLESHGICEACQQVVMAELKEFERANLIGVNNVQNYTNHF